MTIGAGCKNARRANEEAIRDDDQGDNDRGGHHAKLVAGVGYCEHPSGRCCMGGQNMNVIVFNRSAVCRKSDNTISVTLIGVREFDGLLRPVALLECSAEAARELATALMPT